MGFSVDSSGLKQLEKDALDATNDIKRAKKSALSSVGFFVTDNIRSYMGTEGNGVWPDPHGLTLGYRKFSNFGVENSRLVKNANEKSQFSKMQKFFKYIIMNNKVTTGFSFNIRKFDPSLESIVNRMIEGYDITITPDMRKLFAATGFPLRKQTTTLSVKPRTFDPVVQVIDKGIFDIFIVKFTASMSRKNSLFLVWIMSNEIFPDYFDFIFAEACDHLTGSKALKAFIETEFPGKDLVLQDGVYKPKQPDSKDYPIIVFSEIDNAKFSPNTKDLDFLLKISCAIEDKTLVDGERYDETTVIADANTIGSKVRTTIGKSKVGRFWLIVVQELFLLKIPAKKEIIGQTSFSTVHPVFKFEGHVMFSFHKNMATGNPLATD